MGYLDQYRCGLSGFRNEYNRRLDSLKCWWIGQMLNENRSIHEKLTLFWHNHFGVDTLLHIDDIPARPWYDYYLILRANALGNMKQLVKAMTLSPAMMCYLNGNTNKKTSPNENYGRELQELYTIGKGPVPNIRKMMYVQQHAC